MIDPLFHLGDMHMTESNAKPLQNSHSETQNSPDSFPPIQLPEANNGNVQEAKVGQQNEQKMQELLQSMNEESAKLSGYLAEENKIMIDLCNSLVQVTKKLHVSFDIPPRDLSLQRNTRKALLSEEGYLKIQYDEDTHSAFLAEYSSEVVMTVLWVVVPELTKAISVYRKRANSRISFFEGLKKELKNIARAIVSDKTENAASNDAISSPTK